MKDKQSPPKVEECIAYMASLNWRIVLRRNFTYAFANPKAPAYLTPMWFSLGELRDAFKYGF
jgi:hypothetical protein